MAMFQPEIATTWLTPAVAKADENCRCQPSGRLRQNQLQRVTRRLSKRFKAARRGVVVADDGQARGLALGADPLSSEVAVIVAVSERPNAAGPGDRVSGNQARECGELRRTQQRRIGQADRGDLLPLGDVRTLDAGLPRPDSRG